MSGCQFEVIAEAMKMQNSDFWRSGLENLRTGLKDLWTYLRDQWNSSWIAKLSIIAILPGALIVVFVSIKLDFLLSSHSGLLALFILGVYLYFVPTIVAYKRHHRQTLAITVLNVVLGWTVLGWAGALVWACTSDVEPQASNVERFIAQATDLEDNTRRAETEARWAEEEAARQAEKQARP